MEKKILYISAPYVVDPRLPGLCVATSFQDWSHDNTAYEQTREKLANLILRKK